MTSEGETLVCTQVDGCEPGLIFLHGLNSDRAGTKAEALMAYCARNDRAFLSFDMFGHGDSSGEFEAGSISRWTADALTVLDKLTTGPQIMVGSSMGGWVMLNLALRRPDRIAGLIGIAAAPDFTEDLMWSDMTTQQKESLMTDGRIELPSDYSDDPYVISRHLIEDGRKNLLLKTPIKLEAPLRLVQGQQDEDVPWQTALSIADKATTKDVEILLIKNGDHRLSRPEDLRTLCGTVDRLLQDIQTDQEVT